MSDEQFSNLLAMIKSKNMDDFVLARQLVVNMNLEITDEQYLLILEAGNAIMPNSIKELDVEFMLTQIDAESCVTHATRAYNIWLKKKFGLIGKITKD